VRALRAALKTLLRTYGALHGGPLRSVGAR